MVITITITNTTFFKISKIAGHELKVHSVCLFVCLFRERTLHPQEMNRYDSIGSQRSYFITSPAVPTVFVLSPIFNNAVGSLNFEK